MANKSDNWGILAGYCSAHGIAHLPEMSESELKKAIKLAGHELPELGGVLAAAKGACKTKKLK